MGTAQVPARTERAGSRSRHIRPGRGNSAARVATSLDAEFERAESGRLSPWTLHILAASRTDAAPCDCMAPGRGLKCHLIDCRGLAELAFSALTFSQQAQWRDDATIFTVAHQLAPHNDPVARNLANTRVQAALELSEQDRCDEAVPMFEQVTQQYPQDWYAWAGLGSCFVQINQLVKAEQSFHRAADLSHDSQVIQQWQELRAHMGLPSSGPAN